MLARDWLNEPTATAKMNKFDRIFLYYISYIQAFRVQHSFVGLINEK